MYQYKYPRPSVTADIVLFVGGPDNYRLLLIQRAFEPYEGMWALPGGFVDENEDLPDSAARELLEETGIKDVSLKQVGAFGKPGRDPRGHTITVAFAAVLDHVPETLAGDDAAKAQWFALNELPRLAFDHSEIITQAAESCSVLWPNTIAQNKE